MSEAIVTVMGNVATDVRTGTTKRGVAYTTFRLAYHGRRFDPQARQWVDGKPSFYSVTCWRALAENVGTSLNKGDAVVVHGRMSLDDWNDQGRSGTDAEIDARVIGHDLMRGTSVFTRSRRRAEAAGTDEDLDHIRAEHRARRGDEVLVDPETGEMYTVHDLNTVRPGTDPGPGTDTGPGTGTDTGPGTGTDTGPDSDAGDDVPAEAATAAV